VKNGRERPRVQIPLHLHAMGLPTSAVAFLLVSAQHVQPRPQSQGLGQLNKLNYEEGESEGEPRVVKVGLGSTIRSPKI
jgi:hypothetical protein